LLDECPYCGDKALEHDGTGHANQLFLYEMSSSDDEETVEEHITHLRAESASAKKKRRRAITVLGKKSSPLVFKDSTFLLFRYYFKIKL
jgi:hypothetical protein